MFQKGGYWFASLALGERWLGEAETERALFSPVALSRCLQHELFHEGEPEIKAMEGVNSVTLFLRETASAFSLIKAEAVSLSIDFYLKLSFSVTTRLKVFGFLVSLQKYPVRTNWNCSPAFASISAGSTLACSATMSDSGLIKSV